MTEPVETLSYEAARDELVSIVSQLEGGRVPLEESLALWERGEALAAHCAAWLDGAQERITAARTPAPAPPIADLADLAGTATTDAAQSAADDHAAGGSTDDDT